MAIILDTSNHVIPFGNIFGKEEKKVLELCYKLMWRHISPFDNGAPMYPATANELCLASGNGSLIDGMTNWEKNHPEKMKAYKESLNRWNEETYRMLRALYGIAKRHHVHIKWLRDSTTCMPDRFLVNKKGKQIAMIQC